MPQHETFYVIRRQSSDRGNVVITVSHQVPSDAQELGSYADPAAAIDFAQEEVRRLNDRGVAADYIDPPDDLVGVG